MKTFNQLSLNEKAAAAVTYFEAMQHNVNNVKQFAIVKLGYSENEADQVVKIWCDCFKELSAQYDWDQIVTLSQAPVTNEEIENCKRDKKQAKLRKKVKGITATFQSDKGECSYINVAITKSTETNNDILNKVKEIITSDDWGYYCAESLKDEGATFFGDNEKTIKQMRDDYREALKIALN